MNHESCKSVVTAPSRHQENGLGRANASPLAGIAACWDKFLADVVTPLPGGDLPVKGAETGFVAGSGSPNKSYCITCTQNGGVMLSSLPDVDDDRRESRTFNH